MQRLLWAAFLVILLSQAGWSQKKIEQIVARVNSDIILKSDLDRELELRAAQLKEEGVEGGRLQQELSEQSKNALRDLIDRTLLMQVAKEHGLSAELEVLKTMEALRKERNFATNEELEREIIKQLGDVEEFKSDIRTKYLTQRVIDNDVYGRIVITNEEMRAFYDANKQKFDRPAGNRVSEIIVLMDKRLPEQVAIQRKKIEEAFAAIKSGTPFEEVAEKYSEVSTANNGGDMGFFGKGDLNEDVEKLPKGGMSEILTLTDAFAIYKVTDKHEGGILTFSLAQQYIWQELMGKIAPPKVREYLTKLRSDGFVEVHDGFVDTSATQEKPAKP
jgi:peptidyl-prolyl cis-trans isomerase SurA